MQPTPVLRNFLKVITRKIDRGMFRLKPVLNQRRKDEITMIVGYCIACAQSKFNVDIYGICIMSNHYHIYVRDNEANLPWFAAEVNRNIAQCLNEKQGTRGPVWNRDRCNQMMIGSRRDHLKFLLYVMMNPVAAGLVEKQKHWPGMVTTPEDFLKVEGITFARPRYFFKKDGKMPEKSTLFYSVLPGYEAMDRNSYVQFLQEQIASQEKQIRAKRGNKKCLGRRRILKIDPFSAPKKGTEEHGLNPKVACSDKLKRIKLLAFLKNWRIAYRLAWQEYKRGNKEVTFPHGTFKIAWEHKVRVETGGCKEAEDLELILPEFAL